jgi:hypothetical protein
MKKPPALVVTDLDPALGPPLANLFRRCAANPRQHLKLLGHLYITSDWRTFAIRYLRRYLPRHCWIYRGGRHLAIHASPPQGGKTWMQGGEAGKCLARICEAKHAL